MLQKLMSSPIAWAILAIVTIGSLAYAIYCQQVNKRKKGFNTSITTIGIVRQHPSKIEGLQVLFRGKEVKSLCISRIAIWNGGNQTISASDLVSDKPISISLGNDNHILDVEICEVSDESNKFSINTISDSLVSLSFDYLDSEEGAVVKLTHTGTSKDLSIGGKIKGGRPIKQVADDQAEINKYDKLKFVFGIVALLPFTIASLWILFTLIGIFPSPYTKSGADLFAGWFACITLLFVSILGWLAVIKQIKKKTPKSLRFYRKPVGKLKDGEAFIIYHD